MAKQTASKAKSKKEFPVRQEVVHHIGGGTYQDRNGKLYPEAGVEFNQTSYIVASEETLKKRATEKDGFSVEEVMDEIERLNTEAKEK